jgi:hypothetical protein
MPRQIFSLLRVHRTAFRGVGLAAHPSEWPLATAKICGTRPAAGPGVDCRGA